MIPLGELLGESPGMVALRGAVTRLLRSDRRRLPPIFIEGETGTGKTALAHALHRASARRNGPFVAVNSSAITDTLAESQLFGHERGAYTDARDARPGLFQQAHTGTIFLDEVVLMSASLQPKLLKVLDDYQVRRVGGNRIEAVDVWVISASNADVDLAVRERQFREDLFQRLTSFRLKMPPLRERQGDILLLAEHFLTRSCREHHLPPLRLDAGARKAIVAYRWPGNVRQLANVMEKAVLLSEGSAITAEMLEIGEARADKSMGFRQARHSAPLEDEVESIERARIVDGLDRTHWNVSRAAELLGISRNKLRYKIERHKLRPDAQPRQRKPPASATRRSPSTLALSAPAVSSLRWERRRLTFLRAEIVDLGGSSSPPDATRLLELLVDKVHVFGGRVEELGALAIIGVFGLEPAEDAPRRAALAAMAMVQAVELHREEGGETFRVKIGIHLERLLLGRFGSILQLEGNGRRGAWAVLDAMLATAQVGSTLVSRPAAIFLERRFELAPDGVADQGAVKTYRLVGREHSGLGLRGRITPLVGRDAEMQILRDRLDAVMTGQGQAVAIVGEPGIGKSHLLHEFHQSLAVRDVTYLEGRCFAYASTIPYFPVLEVLRANFRVAETDSSESVTDKVRRGLVQIGMTASEAAPYILHLLGIKTGAADLATLSPEAIQARTFETVSELALLGSRHRPLVLAIEDVHWMDTASQVYLTSLLGRLAGVPLLLLMTYRSGYQPQGVDQSCFTQMSLQPLSREDSLKVVQAVLETEQVPDPVARVILAKAEGNPFFLEELARMVGEQRSAPAQTVPETLEEALLARIDRLPEDRKRLLQTASVLGREFPVDLLKELWDMPAELDAQLHDLTRLEFLFARSTAQEVLYVFRHALVHEVAYESFPLSRRRTLHAAAGRAIESLYADRIEEVSDRLAYHYSRTDEPGKAIEYLSRFATRAVRSSAHVEAVAALQEAMGHAERLMDGEERDRHRLSLVLQQVLSLSRLGQFQETLGLLLGETERVERLRDPSVTGPFHFWLGRTYSVVGDHERAIDSAKRALEEAKQCGDRATMGKAYYALAYEDYWSGRARAGVELGRLAVVLLDQTEEKLWLGLSHWVIAINHAHMGDYTGALEAAARVQEIGDATGDPGLKCTAAWTRGMVYAGLGKHEAGIAACQLALESSPNPVNTALAMGFLGASHLENNDPAQAIPLLAQSARQLGEFRVPTQGWFLALLAEAHLRLGNLDRAVEATEQSIRICEEVRYQYGLGWAKRALGRIAMTRGAVAEAEASLREALDSFTSIEARSEVGRTHVALAELSRMSRDHDGVVRHLADGRRHCVALGIAHIAKRIETMAREWGVGPLDP